VSQVSSRSTRLSNPLALAVLVLLIERPMHPYEMSTTLHERRKQDNIKLNFGSLYSVVASLEKRGLVEVADVEQEGNRPVRTIYRVTPEGEETAIAWLSDLVALPRKEYLAFEAALSLIGALAPNEAARLLELRLRNLEVERSADDGVRAAIPPGFPRVFLIESDYLRALREAEITFVRELVAEMAAGEVGGMDTWRRMHELRAEGRTPDEIGAQLAAEFPEMMAAIGQVGRVEQAEQAAQPAQTGGPPADD
jgi:DNA-binding PadR family transcriptional regulator